MNLRTVSASRRLAYALIGVVVFAVLCGAFLPASAERLGPVWISMTFQTLAWAFCMALVVRRDPSSVPRFSDPGVLIQLAFFLYFLYPSVEWCHNRILPYSRGVDIPPETVDTLFWLHGLFMLVIIGAYSLAAGRKTPFRIQLNRRSFPSAWIWYLTPMLPLAFECLSRIGTGGSLLADSSYSERWVSLHSRVAEARYVGGAGYLLEQIFSKLEYFLIIAQGIGGGLLLVRAAARRKHQFATLIAIAGVTGLQLLVVSGARSPFLISFLISLALADYLVGLSWRHAGPILLVGLLAFEFLGYYRMFIEGSVAERISNAYSYIAATKESEISVEFGAMLPKETVALRLFADSREGVQYFVRSLLGVMPAQLIAEKASWQSTQRLLSDEMIGAESAAGGGVAGTAIGDGYRFLGVFGIVISAAILGAMFGFAQRWVNTDIRRYQGPVLLKAALCASLCGFAYTVVRSGLDEIFPFFCYYLLIPWLLAIPHRKTLRSWLRPMPVRLPPPLPSPPAPMLFEPATYDLYEWESSHESA